MKFLYFAWVREQIGCGEEDLSPPNTITTLGALVDWLAGQSDGHAAALADRNRLRAAINETMADWDAPIFPDDEIALFPPMTGGQEVQVQGEDFDPAALLTSLSTGSDSGAVATFTGLVRGAAGSTLTLEHYPGMTERALQDIVAQARARWKLDAVRVVHRHGPLEPGARIVFVGVAARHRAEAFAACEFITDLLKTDAPFWKKEQAGETSHWVEKHDRDATRRDRWSV